MAYFGSLKWDKNDESNLGEVKKSKKKKSKSKKDLNETTNFVLLD